MKIELLLKYEFGDTSDYEEDGLDWRQYINKSKDSKLGFDEMFGQSDAVPCDMEIIGVKVGDEEILFED